jgi:hypothetical protein
MSKIEINCYVKEDLRKKSEPIPHFYITIIFNQKEFLWAQPWR